MFTVSSSFSGLGGAGLQLTRRAQTLAGLEGPTTNVNNERQRSVAQLARTGHGQACLEQCSRPAFRGLTRSLGREASMVIL